MCGIFGVLVNKSPSCTLPLLKSIVNDLFVLSESRGKEAAGIAMLCDAKISIHKEGIIASSFIRSKAYRQLLNEAFNGSLVDNNSAIINKPTSIIGHTRLATNGTQTNNDNNCPIVSGNIIGVHNGIIVNDDELREGFPLPKKTCAVDSESIFTLLNFFINNGSSLIASTQSVFKKIQGSASIATFISNCDNMILATNTGSLYSCRNLTGNIYIFASESYILQRLIRRLRLKSVIGQCNISQIKAGRGCLIDINSLKEEEFSLNQG